MTKLKIQEIIVVEGKDDTRRLQEVVEADTIEKRLVQRSMKKS